MRTRVLTLLLCTTLPCATLLGCDPPEADPDGGGQPADGGPTDPIAPTVRDTTPFDGASGVAREDELVVRFSEPMARDVGSVLVEPGGSRLLAAQGDWDAAGSTLRLRPAGPWPAGSVTVTIDTDFTDLAGNALEAHVIQFETEDDVPPQVLETTPAEGATAISARVDMIEIRFDEPMRAGSGTLDVLGGSATVGSAVWAADAMSVQFPIADLEYERDYDATLRGFVDAVGNRLDGEAYLEDGVLDFSTGVDTDGARVTRSEPAEGQLDVNPADMGAILVTFDEAMDIDIAGVTLSDGTTDTPLTGTWTGNGRVLRVDVAGRLEFSTSYSLDLRALRDRAGTAIDEVTYLADGRLDFTVGLDDFRPFVRATTPAEGEVDVAYTETSEITVSFSEAMDPSITTVTLEGGPAPVELTGTWLGPTELSLDVSGRLSAGAMHSLDLSEMVDTRGNALNTTHAYLGDGRLDFSTSAPVGEGCIDPLTIAQGTESGGTYTWTIGSRQGAVRDGGTSFCDSNGTTANGSDVLIRFDKVSDRPSAGGRFLRVTVDGSTGTGTGNTFDVSVMTGATCSASATPDRCYSNASWHQIDVDAPAGPVWIWVSRTISSTSSVSATVTVTEVDAPRMEGEGCDNPYTAASAIYTAPTGPGTPHRFAIPQNVMRSMDIAPYTYATPNAFSCDTAAGHGIDAVVRFDKPDDASILRVSAQRSGSGDSFNLEVLDACDATATATERLGCRTSVSTTAQEMLVDVPAGPVHVWVGDIATTVTRSSSVWAYNPAINLDIEVIPDVQAGEACSRAIAATSGANAVGGTSDLALNRPSCFGSTSNVEWYRVHTTQEVLLVSADAAGGLALLDPASASEISCVDDGQARTLTRVLPIGTDVCVGVEMGQGITSLNVAGQTYTGLGSRAPVDLEILRPLTVAGTAEESVTSDAWMVVNSSTLLMRHNSSAIMDVSRAGGERAARRGTDDGIVTSTSGTSIDNTGRAAVSVGGALFTFNDATATTGVRVHRMWDGVSATWVPIAWDLGGTYPADEIQAAAQDGATDILFVTDGGTSTTSHTDAAFYRISTLGPSTPQLVGTSSRLAQVRGMVVDDQFVYVSAKLDGVLGIYRVPRASVGDEPVVLAQTPRLSTSTTQATAMAVDSLVGPTNLYFRNADGELEAIIGPASASPFYLGPVIERGKAGDWAMALDPATGQLFYFETETVSTGVWLRYDP